MATESRSTSASEESKPLEIVVQGTRPGLRGTTLQKIDRTMLDRIGTTNVSESLERLPAMHAAFGSRGERMISLRGFDQRQVLVTIDGIPMQMPYDGQIDLGKFPLGLIDHITVVKGSGSLLFGPNGLGGTIDIATRRTGEGPALTVSTESAPFFSQRMSGVATTGHGSVAALGAVSFENVRYFPLSDSFVPTYNEQGGHRTNSDHRSLNAVGKARWEIDDHNEVTASVWHLNGDYGTPPGVYDLTRRFWRWSSWHANSYAIAHGYQSTNLTTDETFYASVVGDTLNSYDNDAYNSQLLPASGKSVYDDQMLGGNARLAYRFACNDARCMTARGWLGARKDWHRARDDKGTPKTNVNTTTLTAAGQLDGHLGDPLQWVAGAQIDAEFPGQGTDSAKPNAAVGLGPMGALTWQPHKAIDLTASAAHRTRFPTLKERYSQGFDARLPNPDLGPERATNLSLDAAARPFRAISLDVGVFDSEVRDIVIQVPVNTQTTQWQNAGRARMYGVELSTRIRPVRFLDVWASWGTMKTRRLDLAPPENVVPYRPNHKATAAVTVLPTDRIAATVVGRYVGTQSFQNNNTLEWGSLGAYEMLDARVDWMPIDGLRVWIRGTNLMDANVQGHYSFPEAGRQLFVGASFEGPSKPGDVVTLDAR